MSSKTISSIFGLYDKALSQTRKRLEERTIEGTKELELFYNEILKDHIISYHKMFDNEAYRREMHLELQHRHRSSNLRFWAIDGACKKIETSDLAIFYGGAYVIKGELGLGDNPPLLQYKESEPEDDSSIVAYLPLSPEDLTAIDPEDRFVVNDSERISISGLDTSLMLLAENYLCYRGASGADRPHMILWDHSLSSVLANATPNVRKLRFSGINIGGENIWYPDLLVGYSKPWNELLEVPSKKSYRLWERVIAHLYQNEDHTLDLKLFAQEVSMPLDKVKSQVSLLWKCDKYGKMHKDYSDTALVIYNLSNDIISLNQIYLHSPEKIDRLYNYFCNQFFREKNPSVLLYDYTDENGLNKKRFLSTDELSFLLAIGLRLTFEACWKNDVLLIGVVKDSASTYFTRNYFGVMRNKGEMSFQSRKIPASDRLTFERLPYIYDQLEGPWSSTEFDSIFMTLRLKKEFISSTPKLEGVRGDILVPPNIIMRSLVQFVLNKKPPMEPIMGHVIFIDRLIQPGYIPTDRLSIVDGYTNPDLGTIEPFYHKNNSIINKEQELVIYLLSVLTRNVFPEVIGYPDPLHHADRGAKTVLRLVEPMLRSSERINRVNPIHKTIRQNRGG